ncbi:SpdD protein [Streptomyces inhibens]|uniref:SpdD protein n=1 Tax=Streptomyces inhibens TaxID=2293571 RepID=A0A371Q8K7_STRIH|nr:SpdD protein [Streptomyces inhibens]REK91009.1 SpdD protein [Streptomyces inhibens]
MLTPKYPTPDTALPAPAPATETTSAIAPVAPQNPVPTQARRAVQLTPGGVVAVAAGGTALVLVVGSVLVSMLLAVAITGVSVAVCAVVLRLLLKDFNTHR